MKEIEFNLLTEPWVRVRRPDNTVQEVSLTDALLHAQDYVDLAGEMPTQDAAMLRRILSPPDLTRASRSKKARSIWRRGSVMNMNYTV